MAVALSIVVALLAILLAAYTLFESRRRDSLISRSVAVHTCDERTLRGVLVAVYSDRIVLRDAAYADGGALHPLGGAQHVPMSNVSFIQELVVVDDRKPKSMSEPATHLEAVGG